MIQIFINLQVTYISLYKDIVYCGKDVNFIN